MQHQSKHYPNKVRLIAGRWRGRYIAVPSSVVRPTPNRIRESLFNCLQHHIRGSHCLDLFAGSGALGFEALSRGAAKVSFIDNNVHVIKHLQETQQALQAAEVDIQRGHAPQCLSALRGPFDIVFLDPPFHQNCLPACIDALSELLTAGAFVYTEYAKDEPLPPFPQHWQCHHQSQAGEVCYTLYRITNR